MAEEVISKDVRAALVGIVGEAKAAEILRAGKEASDTLDASGIAFKESDKPEEGEEEEVDMKGMMHKMIDQMSKMEERMRKMEDMYSKAEDGEMPEEEEEEERPSEEKSARASRSEMFGALQEVRLANLLAEMMANRKNETTIDERKSVNDPASVLLGSLVATGDK